MQEMYLYLFFIVVEVKLLRGLLRLQEVIIYIILCSKSLTKILIHINISNNDICSEILGWHKFVA